jgi:uncharacterized protein YkwD
MNRCDSELGRSDRRRVMAGIVAATLMASFFVAFAPPADAIATGPFTVTTSNRESVRQLFYSAHEAGNGVAPGWTGSIAGCNPGTVTQDFRDATLARINYFRAMAGVPSTIAFTAANNTKAQAAALIMSAQNDLSHEPPNTWACWTQDGFDGAGASNLALGQTGPTAIDQLMYDGGANNTFAGHRRNMLNAQLLEMGTGSVPGTGPNSAAQAQLLGAAGSTPITPRDTYVAWPPKGFVPYQTVYPRWSFSLRGGDFTNATVTMTRPGNVSVPASIIDRRDWSGPGVVWVANNLADGASWPKPTSDEPIAVTVGNVIVSGTPQSFTYTTTIFDPADPDPSHTPLTITGPSNPTVNQANGYSVNTVPNAAGYQWRSTALSPFSLQDGAESGLANFDASPHTYTNPSTDFAATGTHSFRLTIADSGGFEFPQQTLTLDKVVVPSAATVLSFKTRTALFMNQDADVEVSADDGSTWQSVYAEQSTDDSSFVQRTVSLGSFAKKQIVLRFRVQYAGGSVFIADPEGWYIDDIAIGNAQVASAPVASGILAGTGFSFTPTLQAEYDLQVRASFPGSGFGAWSKAKRVSTYPASSLPQALDAAQLTWSTTGSPAWGGQTAVTHDGVDALRSGGIGNSASTSFETTVVGPTKLRYWWKSDSEAGDLLRVTVDGAEPFGGISGNKDWEKKTISIGSGPHTVRWTFSRDAGGSAGANAAWVDEVTVSSK